MTDRARRTSSGSTLRLVPQQSGPADGADDIPRGPGDPAGPGGGSGHGEGDDHISIVLPGQRQSVAVGRHWVVRTAAERGITGMANQVLELLSSELLANAVLHGPAEGAIGVQLRQTEIAVRVSVSDGNQRSPVVMHNELDSANGRGMAIVEAMSSRWGIETHEDGGKTVWYELDLDDF
ncbi:ATP-binding protein [Cellulomonas sp. APG4]|uniref:ATP-binding protein n=1 Tax=Cellulomonas sp. APG4 TaxID=1538656 RepID=UPI001ED8F43D|nr:ATP-binding protein [Cellulomonas sp. APG4]